jgi:hypothetical protein
MSDQPLVGFMFYADAFGNKIREREGRCRWMRKHQWRYISTRYEEEYLLGVEYVRATENHSECLGCGDTRTEAAVRHHY